MHLEPGKCSTTSRYFVCLNEYRFIPTLYRSYFQDKGLSEAVWKI